MPVSGLVKAWERGISGRRPSCRPQGAVRCAARQAENLLDYLSEVIDCWEMKWEPGPPGGRRDGNIVAFKRAA